MKKLMVILSTLALSGLLLGQPLMAQTKQLTKKEQRKLEKQKKKEARKKADKVMRAKYRDLLENKHFVFEGQKVYLPNGDNTNIATNVNFIAVKDNQIVVQFDFPGLNGPNGLGGVTARGKLQNWTFDPGKNAKQAMTVSGQVTPLGSANRVVFTITVSNDGFADAQINLNNSSFRLTGQVVSFDEADVIMGKTNF
jgi:hypothetical protein